MGRLERHLDTDLIARIQRGWRPKDDVASMKRQKPPRALSDYRGARRNAARGSVWRGIKPTLILEHGPVLPNRSKKWAA